MKIAAVAAVVAALLSAVGATTALAGPQFGGPERKPFMETGAGTSQPIGHYEFCKRFADECVVKSTTPHKAELTEAMWTALSEINVEVNQRIIPMTDQAAVGREEVWAYPVRAGDCEDYVLEKRRKLLQRGFAEADLLITVVRKYDGTGHAVLTIKTPKGDFVLDNLDPQVKLWSLTPYHYVKRQSAAHPGRWVEVENCAEDVPVGSVKN